MSSPCRFHLLPKMRDVGVTLHCSIQSIDTKPRVTGCMWCLPMVTDSYPETCTVNITLQHPQHWCQAKWCLPILMDSYPETCTVNITLQHAEHWCQAKWCLPILTDSYPETCTVNITLQHAEHWCQAEGNWKHVMPSYGNRFLPWNMRG